MKSAPSLFADLQNAATKGGVTRGVLYRYIVAQCTDSVNLNEDMTSPKYGKFLSFFSFKVVAHLPLFIPF